MSSPGTVSFGTVIEGRFRLLESLGHGGFGEVWKAADLRLEPRNVAIKFLHTAALADDMAVQRFETEARALSILNSPNIVSIVDKGIHENRYFIAMELLEGCTLGTWLDEYRSSSEWPDLKQAWSLFDQVTQAVEVAHSIEDPGPILHRDLKPSNVFLSKRGHSGILTVKVVDFGLAQLGRREITPSGAMMGTPFYMAPEQAFGIQPAISPATDVFALGVLLIELVTLQSASPSQGPWWALVAKNGDLDPWILCNMRPDLPEFIWSIVCKALARRPEDRFRNAGEMRSALQAVHSEASVLRFGTLKVSLSHVDRLKVLERKVEACHKCKLCESRVHPAFSRGGCPARVLFLGEAPGEEEDRTGIPFTGPSGRLLDDILEAMGLDINRVYMSNVIKCKPPHNREPEDQELRECRPYWEEQIALAGPKVVVTLGRVATQLVLVLDPHF
jgi:serine/threonine protein kinase